MAFPKMVKWMIKQKRWSSTGKKFETKVLDESELVRMKEFLKSDTKMQLIVVEDIVETNEESL